MSPTPNPFTKYQFKDEHGHPLENNVEFQELKKDVDYLTDRAAMYARSKNSYTVLDRANKIRAKWGLDEKQI